MGLNSRQGKVWPLAPSERALRQTKSCSSEDLGIRALGRHMRIRQRRICTEHARASGHQRVPNVARLAPVHGKTARLGHGVWPLSIQTTESSQTSYERQAQHPKTTTKGDQKATELASAWIWAFVFWADTTQNELVVVVPKA